MRTLYDTIGPEHKEILMKIRAKSPAHAKLFTKFSGDYDGLCLIPFTVIKVLEENDFEIPKCNPEKFYLTFREENDNEEFIDWYISIIEYLMEDGIYVPLEITESDKNSFLFGILEIICDRNYPYMDEIKCGYTKGLI